MWYGDLSKCGYFGNILPICIAVGWLENGKPYSTGETAREVVEKICEFTKMPEIRHLFRGYHECDFCDFVNIELGATTVLIAYKNKVYAYPGLITHYIEAHYYRPPDEFIEAVLNYDHQSAIEYFKKITENKFAKKQ